MLRLVAGSFVGSLLLLPTGAEVSEHDRSQITGRVLDVRGAGISGVHVRITSAGEPWGPGVAPSDDGFTTETDSDGRFAFDVPRPTSSWVSLTVVPAWSFGRAGRIFGVAGGRDEDPLRTGANDLGDLVLPDTGAIAGRVVDEEGNSISAAEVSLEDTFPGGFVASARSDVDGTFLLAHVPPGTYAVLCHHVASLRTTIRDVRVEERAITEGLEFALRDAPVLAGVVVTASGAPMAGVRVWGWPSGSGRGAGATSGDDGRFTILLPQDEPYVLEASQQGYEPYEEGHSSPGHRPGTTDVRIVMTALPVTSFAVVDEQTGAPIERYGRRSIEVQAGATTVCRLTLADAE